MKGMKIMAIPQPSQYQVDNMQQGDIVYVKKQNLLYRIYRKLFLHRPTIKVRKDWSDDCTDYFLYYQEDCTLLYYYEVACVQQYENEVPVLIGTNEGKKTLSTQTLKSLQVGLYNAMLNFNNGITITIPVDYFNDANRKNTMLLKQIDDSRIISDLLKFQRYKGNYFKKVVQDNNIKKWKASYCSVCGKPIEFIFKKDKVVIDNKCVCGEVILDKKEFSYDELAIWYYNQTNPIVKKVYDEFWFKKGN